MPEHAHRSKPLDDARREHKRIEETQRRATDLAKLARVAREVERVRETYARWEQAVTQLERRAGELLADTGASVHVALDDYRLALEDLATAGVTPSSSKPAVTTAGLDTKIVAYPNGFTTGGNICSRGFGA